MNSKRLLIAGLGLVMSLGSAAVAKDKKPAPRGMIESMQSLPCGVKERGVNGVGSIFASVGVAHVNSNEKLCPQYLFRTDDMEYHIRPLEKKHAAILPLGREAEFRIKKDKLYLKVVDSDQKSRAYQVVAMDQLNAGSTAEKTAYRPPAPTSQPPAADTRSESRPTDRLAPPNSQSVPPPQ